MKKEKININRWITLLGVTLLLSSIVYGNQDSPDREIVFKHISLDQGLSQVSVICMVQDSRGFMWFGTQDGLNKYDGYDFTVYKPDPKNPFSAGHITITAIIEDRSGQLWIGTQGGGVDRFDRESETFTHYKNIPNDPKSVSGDYVLSICEDHTGRVWVGTQTGLNRFEPKTKTFTRFLDASADNSISSIYEDRSGILWIGSGAGLLRKQNRQTGAFTSYRIPRSPQNIDGDFSIKAIYEDESGNFWIGSDPGGLFRFDRTRETFTIVNKKPGIDSESNPVNAIFQSRNGDLWIGSSKGGLCKFDPKTARFSHYVNNPNDYHSIGNNYVLSIYEDRSGLLWAGTLGGGVNQFSGARENFTPYHVVANDPNSLNNNVVRSICEDRSGALWIGTMGGGLTRIDRRKNEYTHYTASPTNPNSVSGNIIRAIFEDTRGTLWIGTEGAGLNMLNRNNKNGAVTFTRFKNNPGDTSGPIGNTITSICQDRTGSLWFGSLDGGVSKYDHVKGIFTRFQNQPGNPASLSNNSVYSIIEDREGNLWIGAAEGLNKLGAGAKIAAFTHYLHNPDNPESLSNDSILTIHEDTSGFLWIGTRGGGLNRFDPKKETFTVFNETHGLPNNVIYGILEDNSGHLWISTNKGLSRFDLSTKTARNFDAGDGLQSNEFNGGAYFKSPGGEMFFGGVNGFNSFFPEKIKDNNYIPPIVITDFKIFNRSMHPDVEHKGDSPLKKSISEIKRIDLTHRETVFSFEFSALSYNTSQKNKYAYKMEGFDSDWIQSGTRRFAIYTNLNPGQYVFRVKGSNNDGTWNNEGISIKVVIHPPFWKSLPAYVFYSFLVLLLLFGIRKYEMNRLQTKVKLRESELRAAAMEAETRAAQSENNRKTHELEEARKFQLAMLPESIPGYADYEIAAYMEAATEVGGDYYDFHIAENNSLAAAVGDATGHGLKAATMVSVIKGLFCAEEFALDIESFFRKVTHTIQHMRLKNLYMALILMEIKDDRVKLTSAGMPPIFVYRAANKITEKMALKGTPLGAFTNNHYHLREFAMNKGDVILILSDGLPELFNKQEEMFGYEQVEKIFTENASRSSQEIIESLSQAGKEWLDGNPQEDDMTIVVIKRKNEIAPNFFI